MNDVLAEPVVVAGPGGAYTSRQLDVMQRMGLVPWVRRQSSVSALQPAADVTEVAHARVTDDSPGARVLLPFESGGQMVTHVGPSEARLLVVAESGEASAGAALSAALSPEAHNLLILMLRAIELTRNDFALCLVGSSVASPAADPAPAGNERVGNNGRVADLLGPSQSAVLWLSHNAASDSEGQVAQCDFSTAGSVVPWFWVTHPERLLAKPLEKRGAWQVLKDLRAKLAAAEPA